MENLYGTLSSNEIIEINLCTQKPLLALGTGIGRVRVACVNLSCQRRRSRERKTEEKGEEEDDAEEKERGRKTTARKEEEKKMKNDTTITSHDYNKIKKLFDIFFTK